LFRGVGEGWVAAKPPPTPRLHKYTRNLVILSVAACPDFSGKNL